MTSPTDESSEPLGGAGPSARTRAEVKALLAKMYAPPPRASILQSVLGWIARITPKVIDCSVGIYMMLALGAGLGASMGMTSTWNPFFAYVLLFVFPTLWGLSRLGIWYQGKLDKIKALETSVRKHEYRVQYELEPEIERLKEQLRECGR